MLLSTAAAALTFAAIAQPAQSPPTLVGLAAQNRQLALQVTQLQVQVRALQTQIGGIQARLTTGLPGQPSLNDVAQEVLDIQFKLSHICVRNQLVAGFSTTSNRVEYVHCSQ